MEIENKDVDAAFMREARTGLMILVALLALLVYVAAGKLGGWHSPKPLAFQETTPRATGNNLDRNQKKPVVDERWLQATSKLSIPKERVAGAPNSPLAERPSVMLNRNPGPPVRSASNSSAFTSLVPPSQKNTRPISQSPVLADTRPKRIVCPPKDAGRLAPPLQPAGNNGSFKGGSFKATEQRTTRNSAPPRLPQDVGPQKVERTDEQKAAAFSRGLSSLRSFASTAKTEGNPIRRASATEPLSANNTDAAKVMTTVEPTIVPVSESNSAPIVPGSDSLTSANSNDRDESEVPAVLPSPVDSGSVRSQHGDSFWLIAQRVYGEGQYFNALFMANKDQVPSFNEIPAGTVISTPSLADLRKRWPSQCPRMKVTTKGGETPFQLACDHLGQASRYLEILKVNYRVLPRGAQHDTRLPKGLQLVMPRR